MHLAVIAAPTCACTVWYVLAALAFLALATWAHLRFWVARLQKPLNYNETHRIATPDGSAFDLLRLGPGTSPLPPVLVVHGVAMNHRNLDTDENLSLPRHLHRLGRDVWLLRMRCGRHDLSRQERRTASFQALASYDVPLAVREVLRRTGADQLDYIGFSMGGILLYATLGRSVPEALVRRAVVMGSPGRIGVLIPGFRWLLRLPAAWMPRIPFHTLSRLAAFASEWVPTPIQHNLCNPHNCVPGSLRLTSVDAVQSVPGPLAHDFVRFAYTDQKVRLSDGRDILDGLAHIRVPVRFFAGARDRLGPPRSLEAACRAWGAQEVNIDKQLTILGVVHGYSADYGHADLAIGRQVAQEVFEPISQFLGAAA